MLDESLIRVLIVDDSALVCEGLAAVLSRRQQMEVVAQASNGLEAVAFYREFRPDVTLMDLRMPQMDGLTALGAILDEFHEARIVVLTTFAGQEEKSIQAGAKAALLKEAPGEELLATIRRVHAAPLELDRPAVPINSRADKRPGR